MQTNFVSLMKQLGRMRAQGYSGVSMLKPGTLSKIRCLTESGVFSGELTFSLILSSGDHYEGFAPLHYFEGSTIRVRTIDVLLNDVRVRLPGGEVVLIPKELI